MEVSYRIEGKPKIATMIQVGLRKLCLCISPFPPGSSSHKGALPDRQMAADFECRMMLGGLQVMTNALKLLALRMLAAAVKMTVMMTAAVFRENKW